MRNREPAQIDKSDLSRQEIPSLDQALYVASCFAASAKRRTVRIWSTTIDGKELYRVEDMGARIYGHWTPCFELTAKRGEFAR